MGQIFNQVGNLPSYDEDDQIEISLSLNKSVFQNMGSDHTKILLINSLLTQCLGTLNIKPVKGNAKNSSSNSAFCSGDGGGGGGLATLKQEAASNSNSVDKSSAPVLFNFDSQQNSTQMDSRDYYSNNSHCGGSGASAGRMSSFGDRNGVSISF